jgi:hypothetical protein
LESEDYDECFVRTRSLGPAEGAKLHWYKKLRFWGNR